MTCARMCGKYCQQGNKKKNTDNAKRAGQMGEKKKSNVCAKRGQHITTYHLKTIQECQYHMQTHCRGIL